MRVSGPFALSIMLFYKSIQYSSPGHLLNRFSMPDTLYAPELLAPGSNRIPASSVVNGAVLMTKEENEVND